MGDFVNGLDRDTRKLAAIKAITDEAFTHLNVEELLDVLLDRLREVLEVDTAVVLMLDRQERFLVATAAKGIEEEVSQAAHVPVGQGFAGRIAAERRPVYIEDVATAEVFNPLLMKRGLRSLFGVPLIAGGTLLGVLHVGSFTTRHFTADETELVQMAAARAAMAAQVLLSQAERAGALELQRSLVPAALPAIPGMDLAARYRPGKDSVGGDWYDVFTLPTGRIGIVMGDVAGHGLGAAVVMGRMRSALRAYALESGDPAEVLRRLDRKMQHFEPGATATVLYAVVEPGLDQVRASSAGHWPPVLALPGEPARSADVKPDLLIGFGEDDSRRTTSIDFPPGALLCLYTDGLIERRDSPIDREIGRLCEAMYAGPTEKVSAAVMAELIGRRTQDDDVALLMIRRNP
ncbi:PP2C family protein-serine/threonine phosphatase [Actinomadura roseirufa]|uniref:PP2C family protein-serine/threonine phosphatase n=1 Tax=Actinomadura roseirufa TaxID=2094049 RepID=UPI0010414E03|nr:GAF domain-containing SpoIIE family protein phosphatase [Actinomadura roseirufa]